MRSILILLLLTIPAAAAEVAATRLDGRTFVGELKSWDGRQAEVATKNGVQRVPAKELLSLRWPTHESDEEVESSPASHVELIDGTLLPMTEFRVVGNKARLTLAAPSAGSQPEISLSRRLLAAVQLKPLDAALTSQWQEIRDMKPAADVLVVLKRDGKSLDYVEGVLGDVTPSKIAFELDGDAMKIDREKLAGFIYFRREANSTTEPLCIVHSRSGLKSVVEQARMVGDSLQLTTVSGVDFAWPLDDVAFIDFSAGKLVYLSDLEMAARTATPLVALPAGATLAQKYGEPRRDQSAYGGPLTLSFDNTALNSNQPRIQSYTKGLAVRSRTELAFRLPAGYRRLGAVVGIDPAARASGNVRLEIVGDDRPLFEADIAGADEPRVLDLDITDVKRLKVFVDYAQNLDTGDWLNICDLKIVK